MAQYMCLGLISNGGVSKTMERVTRARAIRLKCLDCCCGQSAEVRRCPSTNCPLWIYRMGREVKTSDSENLCENSAYAHDFEDEDVE